MLRLSKMMKFSQEHAAELEELLLTSSTASYIKLVQVVVASGSRVVVVRREHTAWDTISSLQ